MKEIKKQSFYEEPEIQVIHMTETDIITTSGGGLDDENPIEGEITPILPIN